MTYDSPVWDPYDPEFARIEDACREKLEVVPTPRNRSLEAVSSTI
jgi:hypothetical protein